MFTTIVSARGIQAGLTGNDTPLRRNHTSTPVVPGSRPFVGSPARFVDETSGSVGTRTNVALASAGATAIVSSMYSGAFSPAGVIDGDRTGRNWEHDGGWADATPGSFPDWVEVNFATSSAISQVNVFSVQDNYTAPVEPTPTQTFTLYGLRDFEVQYWTGTMWARIPGATITDNVLIWRAISFSPVTTRKIRILITAAADDYTRIAEVEAYASSTVTTTPPASSNVALASAGATAVASSMYSSAFSPAGVIDGDRTGRNWEHDGGWADATPGFFPDWVEVDFPISYTINQVDVFSVQDNYTAPIGPTPTQTFTLYGVRDFQVQYWTGIAWVTIPGATISDNSLVWRAITFSPVTTEKIRVLIAAAADGYSRITELEAYATSAVTTTPATGSNVALAAAGAIAIASSMYSPAFSPAGVIDGDRAGRNWEHDGGWADATPDSFPDWVEVDFPTSYAIDRINVFSVQDNYTAPLEPTATQTFTLYGLRDFEMQYWTGTAWATISGATISGNTLVSRAITFSPVTTRKIRVLIAGAADGYSRIAEIEAYTGIPTITPQSDPDSLSSRVLVVYNSAVLESVDVADYYMQMRGIPATNRCAIYKTGSLEWFVSLEEYVMVERDPIRACLAGVGPDKILYIVFSYGTPFKTQWGSTDQLISDIWERLPVEPRGFSKNPYYALSSSVANSYKTGVSLADFRLTGPLVYSVWRLDAPTSILAKSLVDQAVQVEAAGGLSGYGCFDRLATDTPTYPDTGVNAGDWDILRASQMFRNTGFAVIEDTNAEEFGTAPARLRCDGAAFYTGWYSYGHYNDAFNWNSGAIGWHLDSASATSPRRGDNWSGGALGRGIAVTTGAVMEPYLEGLPHADGALRNLLEGMNVGDAIFRNTAWIHWMIINIGDPLYRPFAGGRVLQQ